MFYNATYGMMSAAQCFATKVRRFMFFFNDTETTEIYTLSLHDALPIAPQPSHTVSLMITRLGGSIMRPRLRRRRDRKSTRLNSSHVRISYAVFCLKKKTSQYNTFFYHKKKKNKKT